MPVVMADYSHKNIEDIEPGDLVKSYDFKKQKVVAAKVLSIKKQLDRRDQVVNIEMEDGSLYYFSLDQQFYVPSLWAFVPAKLLSEDMTIMSFPLQFKKIKKVYTQKINMRFFMYFFELTIEDTENFFVTKDNLLVHNNPVAFPLCAAPLIPECTAVALEAIAMTVASPAFLPAVGTIAAGLAIYYSYNAVVSRYSSASQPQEAIPVEAIYEKSPLQPGEISSFFQTPRAFQTTFPVNTSNYNPHLLASNPVYVDPISNVNISTHTPAKTMGPPNIYSCDFSLFGKDCTLFLQVGPTRQQALALAEMERQQMASYAAEREYEAQKRVVYGSAFIKYLDEVEREVRYSYKGCASPSEDFTRDINAYRSFCQKLVNNPASLDLNFNIEFPKIGDIVKEIVRQEIGRVHVVFREKYQRELAEFISRSLKLDPRTAPACYNSCLNPFINVKCYQDTAGSYWIKSPDNSSQSSWFTFSKFGEGLMMSHENGQFLWIKDSLPIKNYLDVMKGCARTFDKNLPPIEFSNSLTISAYKEKETENTWINISSDLVWRVYSKNMTKIAEIDYDGSLIWALEKPFDFYGLLRSDKLSNAVWENMPEPKESIEDKKKEPLEVVPIQDAFLVNAVHLSKAFFEEYFCSYSDMQDAIASDPSLVQYLSDCQEVEKDLLKTHFFNKNDPDNNSNHNNDPNNKGPKKDPNWRSRLSKFLAMLMTILIAGKAIKDYKNNPEILCFIAAVCLVSGVIIYFYTGAVSFQRLIYYASVILRNKSYFCKELVSLAKAVVSKMKSSPCRIV